MIVLWIALGFSSAYLLLQIYYLRYWHKTKVVSISPDFVFSAPMTIVVVAHNEGKSIEACLQGILNQTYPSDLVRIIVINDHSTDTTIQEVLKIRSDRIALYNLEDFPQYIKSPAYKKSAITLAVDKATTEYIVTTDADCIHSPEWLASMVYRLEKEQLCFLTAPVLIEEDHRLVTKMQETEQLVLMLVTGAGMTSGLHQMANGANMAFRKSAFQQVGGYAGNEQYASGDDMFLVEKMKKHFPDQIAFQKSINAAVYTKGKKTWTSLLRQRLRWAGKNNGLESPVIKRIWIFLGFYHIILFLSLVAALFFLISPIPFIILFVVKWIADFLIISTAASFFHKASVLRFFVPLQFLYSYYILRLGVSMVVGKKGDWQRS